MQITSRHVLSMAIALLTLWAGAMAVAGECEFPQDCSLLMKSTCEPGSPIKFKLAGPPLAKFRLYFEASDEPLPPPGTYEFCPEVTLEREFLIQGHLNEWGFRSLWGNVPDDPALEGKHLRFWFASLEGPGLDGISLSNPVELPPCDAEGSDCDGGIRRLGYFAVARASFEFPVRISSSAYDTQFADPLVGQVEVLYDPNDPPEFPIVSDDGAMAITRIEVYAGLVFVESLAKGCNFANGRLPNETTFEVQVDDVFLSRSIHTSCSVPISVGSRFNPFTISYMQDVQSAPPGDCDP